MMNSRELFTNIMSFKKPDRTPLWDVEGVAEQAVRKWCRDEGFPLQMSGSEAFDYDGRLFTLNLGDQPPIPAFVPKTLSLDEDYHVYTDYFGFVTKTQRKWSITPTHNMYIGAPLSTMEDWQAMKKRYNPSDIQRYPVYWGKEYFDYLNASSSPVTLGMNWGPARGIKNGYMFGFDRYMELLVEEPEILEDIFEFWADFLINFLKGFIGQLKLDAFYFKEDGMGFKNSTMVSPGMFRKIYMPYMRRVVDFLHTNGVKVIGYYSSGNLRPLIPSFLETGINLLVPMECAAGMDAVELRKEYGKDLLMIGNIAKEAVMAGKTEIDREVLRKVSYLMEKGGYIPALDDLIMPDMMYENVKYCFDRIKEI